MGNVYETTCKISRVGCTKSCVRKSLSGSVGGNEVFEDTQTFTEVCLDRNFYSLTCSSTHESTHTADLTHLALVTSGSGLRHDIEVVVRLEGFHESIRDIVGRFFPLVFLQSPAFAVGEHTHSVRAIDPVDPVLRVLDDAVSAFGYLHVVDTDRDGRLC